MNGLWVPLRWLFPSILLLWKTKIVGAVLLLIATDMRMLFHMTELVQNGKTVFRLPVGYCVNGVFLKRCRGSDDIVAYDALLDLVGIFHDTKDARFPRCILHRVLEVRPCHSGPVFPMSFARRLGLGRTFL